MYVDVKIYNSNHIGGYGTLITITENDRSSPKIKEKILIDFGSALPGAKNIDKRLINFDNKTPTSIFFTHYHSDHMGRLVDIPNADNIKIYMSEITYNVTLNIHKFLLDHKKYIPENHSLTISENIVKKLEDGKNDETIIFIKNDHDIELKGVDFELIYSKWTGYLEENASYANNQLIEFCKKYNAITCFNNDSKKYTHTSGHAYPKLIAEIINRIHPSKQILPMHTENPKEFELLDICEDLKEEIIYSYELTPDEQKVLENYETKDQRHISDELKNEFTTGKLKEFLNFVRNHNDKIDRDKTKNDNDKLLILFRGNSNKISITQTV